MHIKYLYNNSNALLILISAMTFVLILDMTFVRIQPLATIQMSSNRTMVIFYVIFIMFLVGECITLSYVSNKSRELRSKSRFIMGRVYTMIIASQGIITALFIAVVLQMVLYSQYHNFIITVCVLVSYSFAIFLFGLLASRFFFWFRSEKKLLILSYAISSSFIALNLGSTMILTVQILQSNPPIVAPDIFLRGSPFIAPSSIQELLYGFFFISSILSFILTWVSTTMLLRHYTHKIGRLKFWIIISLPLLYFASQFLTLSLGLYNPLIDLDPIFFSIFLTILYSLSLTIGGIFFGLAFLTVAKKFNYGDNVRTYLIITTMGYVIFFTSNQAFAIDIPIYPPFGLATVSLTGLSSYFIFVGVYSSALLTSQDDKLRRYIRTSLLEDFELLSKIGDSERKQELERKVVKIAQMQKTAISDESGLSPDLDEEQAKQYLDEVIDEIKTNKHTEK